MKKVIIFFVLVGISLTAYTQEDRETVEIAGKINVSAEGNPSKINVYNLTSKDYTSTDQYGKFRIEVAEEDELVFSSAEYQQFTVIITEGVIKEKVLTIDLKGEDVKDESTIELDEVVVKPDLSGDVEIDVSTLKTNRNMPTEIDVDEAIYGYEYEFRNDRFSTVDHEAVDKGYLKDGINFVNIFKSIFKNRKDEKASDENLDKGVRKLYNDEFFKRYLDIKEEEINDFIFFMEDRGLTVEDLIKYNDLEVIEYLIKESKAFHKRDK